MIVDRADNSVGICEGGVWVYAASIAEKAGVTEEEVMAWLEGYPHHEYMVDALVDMTVEMFAEAYKGEH